MPDPNDQPPSVAESSSNDSPQLLIVVLHGIRTEAPWFDRFATIVKDGIPSAEVVIAGYGYVSLPMFLLPGLFRKVAVKTALDRVDAAITNYPNRRLILVGHSFGTYCIGQILREVQRIVPIRVLLCGSVLDHDFPWAKCPQWKSHPSVLNDYSSKDVWPRLAWAATFGYGKPGARGFQYPGVTDRHHPVTHSEYFENDFIRDNWVPFLRDGTVIRSREDAPEPSLRMRLAGWRPLGIPWLIWLPMLLLGWFLRQHIAPPPGIGRVDFLRELPAALTSDSRITGLSKSLDFKARQIPRASRLPVTEQYTFFVEAPDHKTFVKLQLLKLGPRDQSRSFRPYSTNSKGEDVQTRIFRVTDDESDPIEMDRTAGTDLLTVPPGSSYLIVFAEYDGALIDTSDCEAQTGHIAYHDWHEVEVSDVSGDGVVKKYFFASGGFINYAISLARTFDVTIWDASDRYVEKPPPEETGLPDQQIPEWVFTEASKVEASQGNFCSLDPLDLLTSRTAFRTAKWAWDSRENQDSDVFYVTTRPAPRN